MTHFMAILGAGLVGICVALEPTINSGLGRLISPRLATLHSFVTGTLIIAAINLVSGGFSGYLGIMKAPSYLWIGGVIGAIVVFMGSVVAPVIGIAATLTVMISVQMVTGILIDFFGLFGGTRIPLDWGRVLGVFLIIIAVKLIVK